MLDTELTRLLQIVRPIIQAPMAGRPARRASATGFVDRLSAVGPLPWPLQRFAAEDIYAAAFARGDAELGGRGAGGGSPARAR